MKNLEPISTLSTSNMPKLPADKLRKVIRFLEHSGFQLDHASGSHFIYYHQP